MIHISWPLWTPELRRLIKQLKSEGKLREQPLWELDKKLARCLFFLLGSYLPIALGRGVPLSLKAVMFCVCIYVPVAMLYYYIKKDIMPYTIGIPLNGYIASPVQSGSRLLICSPGLSRCFFDYKIEDQRAPAEVQEKYFKVNSFSKNVPEMASLQEGSKVTVLVNPSSPKYNFPYFPSLERIYKLTTDPIDIGEKT